MQALYPNQRHIGDHYDVVGFISSGTYGRVYKAKAKVHGKSALGKSIAKDGKPEVYAIKK